MKKVRRLFLFFIIFMFLGVFQVQALESDDLEVSLGELPYSYTSGEYSYTIEGMELELYSYEDLEYADIFTGVEPCYVIPITDSSITIEPEAVTRSSSEGGNHNFVYLNADISNEYIEDIVVDTLLEDDSSVSEDYFMVFLNVKYQVNGIPQDLHAFKLGFINMLLMQNMDISSSFNEQTKELVDYMAKKINVNDMNSQIADCYLFDLNEGLITFDEVGDLSDYELIFMSDGLILTHSESLGDAFYNFDNQQDVQFKLFSFHNVSYLNNLLESEGFDSIDTVISSVAKEEGNVADDFLDNVEDALVVDVPDTALNINSLFYISGFLILVVGGCIIGGAIYYKKKKGV